MPSMRGFVYVQAGRDVNVNVHNHAGVDTEALEQVVRKAMNAELASIGQALAKDGAFIQRVRSQACL